MSDFEDAVRRTFAAHRANAPSADGLLANVQTAASRGRAVRRWLMPLAASALTASLVVAVVTDGFRLLGSETASQPVPAATTSTPTPKPSQSAVAVKCDMPPLLHAPGTPQMTFNEDNPQEVTLSVGQRIFMAGVIDSCGGMVTFDGRPNTNLFTGEPSLQKGAGFLKSVRPGTVQITAVAPICPPFADCFGGMRDIGTITVVIKMRPTPEPVIRPCDTNQISLTASSEQSTAGRQLAAILQLANGPSCLLSTRVRVDVTTGNGTLVRMPQNPSSRLISEPIRPRSWLVVRWHWGDPFCGDDFPYAVTLSLPLLGLSDTVERVNVPQCPTVYGEPATDPRGLELASLLRAKARR